ncbi:hypothetical protein BBF96_07620 [Anoxybacter fermentans]|uniref:Uncharacterized protein n=1 Tax=Anoxybacter fermentans TaxID=1323375 RepID=A0A3Q9HQJ0_9FIRM|nr:hypothetical protein BBF96_07620 [Anoxybacter fermentans]
MTEGSGFIERSNGMRMIEVSADLYNRDLKSTNLEIEGLVEKNVVLPDQYSIDFGGQYREMKSAFDSLGFAFILSIILVYMVFAVQFESLWHPLTITIMFTVPLALTGALASLFFSSYTLSVLSIISMIMLVGIIGEGAGILVPFAVVVIGGLIFLTFLTLLVVPAIYFLIDCFGDLLRKGFAGFKKE